VTVIIHFVADWAENICGPHRAEVATAAQQLGASVRECNVDLDPETAVAYGLPNVPAVAIDGHPETLVVGAHPSGELVRLLASA